MRKIFSLLVCCLVLALPLSAIYADNLETEIPLLEIFESGNLVGDSPLDGPTQTESEPPSPTDFRAYVSGRNLTVTSEAVSVTRVIVRNRVTNQTVVNRQFLTIDTEQLSAGAYSIELQCEDLTLVGQFDAE